MKKNIVTLTLLLGASMLLSSCYAGLATMDSPGFLYADRSLGYEASGSVGTKTGRACTTSILGLISTGDGSIRAAASEGGINNVTSVSREIKNILGFYADICTVVTGN